MWNTGYIHLLRPKGNLKMKLSEKEKMIIMFIVIQWSQNRLTFGK